METIRGIVTSFLKRDEKSFVLVEYEDPDSGKLVETRVSARMGSIEEGDAFLAEGTWYETTFRGAKQRNFKAQNIRPAYPRTVDGIRRFLELSFPYRATGIAGSAIRALTEKYQESTIDELFGNPDLLVQVSSNPARYREQINDIVAAKGSGLQARELMVSSDFDEKAINRVLARFKSSAYETIITNPFEVMEAEIPFEQADKLGNTVGVSGADERRVTAAIWGYIRQAEQNGSSLINLTGALQDIARNTGLPEETIRAAVEQRRKSKEESKYLVMGLPNTEDAYAMSQTSYSAETTIASALCGYAARGGGHDPRKVEAAAEELLEGTSLDVFQRRAVITSSSHLISVITGGPGMGKSTILEYVVKILRKLGGTEAYFVTAPTGKAAQRAEETTGMEATTLQMLLGMHKDPQTGRNVYRRNRDNPLPDHCLVVVDEMSMTDNELFAALLAAMPPNGRLVMLGDPKQLPSVGVGRVLADLLEIHVDGRNLIPVSHLKHVYRQDKDSKIVRDSVKMLENQVPTLTEDVRGGTAFKECPSHKITDKIVELYTKNFMPLGMNVLKDVAVITPQAPGSGGTWEVNAALAKLLNPKRTPIPGVEHGPYDRSKGQEPLPHVGDRVMLTENDHDVRVMNGDVGFVRGYRPDPKNPGKHLVQVEFDNGKKLEMTAGEARYNLMLAYAITCHKSQGSQFPVVVLPFSEAHRSMADRTLVFTAWTRAKSLVIGVGDKDVLSEFVRTDKSANRFTLLRPLTEALARTHKIKPLGESMGTVPAPRYPGIHSLDQRRTPSASTPLSARPASSSVGVRRRRSTATSDAAATAPSNAVEAPKTQQPTAPATSANARPSTGGMATRRRSTVASPPPKAEVEAPKPAPKPAAEPVQRPEPTSASSGGLATRRRRTASTIPDAKAPTASPEQSSAAPTQPASSGGLATRRRRSILGAAADKSNEEEAAPPPRP